VLTNSKIEANCVRFGQGWPQFSCYWSRRLWENISYQTNRELFTFKGKKLTIACSTGIASTHYGKLGGTTLHSSFNKFADLHQACLLFDVFPNFIRLLNEILLPYRDCSNIRNFCFREPDLAPY
jgi:hypothetical protein